MKNQKQFSGVLEPITMFCCFLCQRFYMGNIYIVAGNNVVPSQNTFLIIVLYLYILILQALVYLCTDIVATI